MSPTNHPPVIPERDKFGGGVDFSWGINGETESTFGRIGSNTVDG